MTQVMNTGSATLTMPSLKILPAGPPHTYLGAARHFIRGAKALTDVGSGNEVSIAFLAAQATECVLKVYLSRSGIDDRLRKSPLRHDLVALWKLASMEGLPVNEVPPDWLAVLGHLHDKPYFLRYATGVHGLALPAVQPMLNELSDLLDLVERQLVAS